MSLLILFNGAPATAPAQGMGPGFNLHPTFTRKRKREDLAEDVQAAFDRANEAETPKERREAVNALKRVVANVIAEPDYAAIAQSLKALQQFQMSAVAYLDAVGKIIAAEKAQEQDDLEAFLLIAEAA